jgi:hypothetical protein
VNLRLLVEDDPAEDQRYHARSSSRELSWHEPGLDDHPLKMDKLKPTLFPRTRPTIRRWASPLKTIGMKWLAHQGIVGFFKDMLARMSDLDAVEKLTLRQGVRPS